jgi:hypothetical protein
MGITNREVDAESFLGQWRDFIHFPLAASTNGLSSATDGGVAAAVSVTAAVVGTKIFRTPAGKKPLSLCARRLSFTKTDASSTDLKITLRVTGRRFGVQFSEDVVMNAAGTETVFSSRVYDELALNFEIISITAPAASDTLAIGFDAKWVGLRAPIRDFTCIRQVDRQVAGTRDAVPKTTVDITSAMVKVGDDSAVDLSALYATDMLATHSYDIQYFAGGDRAGRKQIRRAGLKYG